MYRVTKTLILSAVPMALSNKHFHSIFHADRFVSQEIHGTKDPEFGTF